METKLIAAELATAAGCATVITMGSMPTRILTIVQGHNSRTAPPSPTSSSTASLQPISEISASPPSAHVSNRPGVEFASPTDDSVPPHTLFMPKTSPLSSRRFWILHGLTPRGTVFVDEGAYRAITRGERDGGGGGNGGRLLAAGVLRVEGTFAAGQAVRVCVVLKKGANKERGRSASRKDGRVPSRARSPDHFADRSSEREEKERELARAAEGLSLRDVAAAEKAQKAKEDAEEVIEFGRGLTNYNSVEIDRVKGLRRCATVYCRTCRSIADLVLALQLRHREGYWLFRGRTRRRVYLRSQAYDVERLQDLIKPTARTPETTGERGEQARHCFSRARLPGFVSV